MSSITIQRGNTLSGLAQKYHTTVARLMAANHQIQNPNLIYAGAQLNIPGRADTFERSGNSGGSRAASTSTVGATGPAPKGQVGQWITQAQKILAKAGVPAGKMNAQDIATIIQHESGGNPNAQNNWDSNAAAGHPSIGLMQTIGPTFNSYKLAGHDNIRNPVDNIIAGVRYAISRYGSVSNVPGVRAVHQGGAYVGY